MWSPAPLSTMLFEGPDGPFPKVIGWDAREIARARFGCPEFAACASPRVFRPSHQSKDPIRVLLQDRTCPRAVSVHSIPLYATVGPIGWQN
jgi:hypothetical protein